MNIFQAINNFSFQLKFACFERYHAVLKQLYTSDLNRNEKLFGALKIAKIFD